MVYKNSNYPLSFYKSGILYFNPNCGAVKLNPSLAYSVLKISTISSLINNASSI